ncbi:MAG: hypothetical protein IK115_06930, partial [Lachnospiraceae bacterium]|nr:hypothetical protein [Lachnospiraceae bacterium]
MDEKRSPILYFGLLALILSLALAGSAVYVRTGYAAKAAGLLGEANHALNTGDTVTAAQKYREVLNYDGENLGAVEGLMQLAWQDKDEEELLRLCYIWMNLAEQKGGSEASKLTSVRGVLRIMDDAEAMRLSLQETEQGNIEEALNKISSVDETRLKDEEKEYKARLIAYLAEADWNERALGAACEKLSKACALAPDSEELAFAYARVARERALELADMQNFEGAAALCEKLPDSMKKETEDYLAKQQKASEALEQSFEKLSAALESGDAEKLSTILQEKDLETNARLIRSAYRSEALRSSGNRGDGLALYRMGNRSYIYYGGMADGKREGDGQWFFSEGEGKLTCFTLSWEADLPEGKGSRDQYSALVSRGEGGSERTRSATHENDVFTLKGGVMDGKYEMKSEVLTEYPYEYGISYNLKNGYCPQILPGEYPELIDYYLAYPQPLAGWTEAEAYDPFYEEDYTTTIWYLWTPNRWTVDGIDVAPARAASQ